MSENQEKKGIMKQAARPFKWFARGHVDAVKAGILPFERKYAHEIIKGSTRRIKEHVKALHAPRDPNAPGAPDMENFDEVLAHWGITRQQLPGVIQAMQLQIFVYFLLGFASLFGLYFGYKASALLPILSGGMIFTMSAIVVVCRTWRVQVLKCERFFFFKHWITGRAA